MESKSAKVAIRVAPAQLAEWRAAAASEGLSLSAWLSHLATIRAAQTGVARYRPSKGLAGADGS